VKIARDFIARGADPTAPNLWPFEGEDDESVPGRPTPATPAPGAAAQDESATKDGTDGPKSAG
jgi:hypothetical protein